MPGKLPARTPPPAADGTYLHECARLHVELMSRLSRRPQVLAAVEKAVASVRSRGALRYEDIEAIVTSPYFAAGKQFWSWPGREEIETSLVGRKLDLWKLPKNEQSLIRELRAVFKTIEPVSVILRFVAPKHYGILSAPVEHVLGIQPAKSSIDRYIAYLGDLRLIQDKYKFETAALVDQALWTLQVGVRGGILEGKEDLFKAHAQDKFLRSIRVKNLADAMFGETTRVDLAEALSEHRASLAGELAAIEFERAVQDYANVRAETEGSLEQLIDEHAPLNLRDYWHRCRRLRNRAVHGRALDQRDVETLVTHTRDIQGLTHKRRRRY